MAKNKPGLPEGFTLNVADPIQLGDYLDEDMGSNIARALVKQAELSPPTESTQTNVVVHPTQSRMASPARQETPRINRPTAENYAVSAQEKPSAPDLRSRATSKGKPFRRPGRMQLNLRSDTEILFEEIIEFTQRYSTQMDVTASEIFEGMVSILHQAKDEMSFENVPRRGKWGTPTAKAFPVALGNAFAKAIVKKQLKLKQPE